MRSEIEADILDDIIDDLLSGRFSRVPAGLPRRKAEGDGGSEKPSLDGPGGGTRGA